MQSKMTGTTADAKNQQLQDILTKAGVKPTKQRLEILDFLLERCMHPSADEIYAGMQAEGRNISRATIYNTINLFEQCNLVRVVDLNEDVKHYDLYLENHAHYICLNCHRIWDVELPEQFSEPGFFALNQEATIEKIDLVIKGYCQECSFKAENK